MPRAPICSGTMWEISPAATGRPKRKTVVAP